MILTRRYQFSSSHRLHSPALDETTNRETYGRCNNPHGHGHNYVLEVSVGGAIDPQTGRVVALGDLDDYVRETVLKVYAGKHMNIDIDSFRGDCVPTTENVAADVRRRLESNWPKNGNSWPHTPTMPSLAAVRLFETRKNIFDI
jgi:6-pyruvoyltetrahydropterin/6-carboxytetrahydropterin synthase